ncbi:MAG: sulfatase-like hydrolase/transferase [Bacteroidota bacterium]|nr:sulfatase-like hydrolase/transferase [Bacteroidota bacterium]
MKKIKLSLVYLGLVCIALYFQSCQNTTSKNDEINKPNIVLIFMDDMGYADVGCFGATDYQTPNIDQLAKQGMRFTDFYVSQAVCSASRASLLTACYSERVGIQGALNSYSNIGINSDETIIPEILKEVGYATGIFGKWHLGHHKEFLPLQHGFDEYVGLPYSNDMWPVGYDGVPQDGLGKRKSNYPPLTLFIGNEVIDTIATLKDQAKLTTIYTENALRFIQNHKEEPFFLYMPHSMVHVPIAVSDKFKGKSGQGLFADVMMEVDWSVGEILKTLEENDLDKNTLVIFTSDNGPWLNFGNHAGSADPLREGKGTMWEGGPRVSTVMRWPGIIPEGSECNQIAASIDLLPTFAEITGIPLPEKKIDGVSILSLMKGEKDASPRNQYYYYYGGELIAVRKDNWKLVFPHTYRSYKGVEPGKDGWPGSYNHGKVHSFELYDLKNDISETKNLASQQPEIVEQLKIIGDSARAELGDRIQNIKGRAIRKPGRIYQEKVKISNLATGKNISIKNPYAYQYSGHGDKTLINGVIGSLDYSDDEWLGFQETDVEIIVDLKEITTIKQIECRFLINQGSWIFGPEKVVLSVSTDGNNYKEIKPFDKDSRNQNDNFEIKKFKTDANNSNVRFVKMLAKNIGTCPQWHESAGGKAWLFLDEIIIN